MERITRGVGRWWRIPSTATATVLVVALVLLVGSAPAATRTTSSAQRGAHTGKPATSGASTGAPTRVGPTDPMQAITITLSLAGQSPADLARTIAGIVDPNSPDYHHYLTPDDYAKRFGASAAVQARVEDALRAARFAIAPHPAGSTLVSASGTVGQAETLFGVKLDNYRDAGGTVYYAPESGPHLPPAMAGVVISVLGLDNRPLVHRASARTIPQTHPAPQVLGPSQLATAYDIKSLKDAGLDGSGQTMAFAEIDTFKRKDIETYDKYCGLDCPNGTGSTLPPVEEVKVDGGADKAKDVSETTLDIEVVHAIAPQTHLIAYEGPADFGGLTHTFAKIVKDNRAQVVSISLGGCEPAIVQANDLGTPYLNTLNTIFQQAAAQGMTVLVASGDEGAYTCQRNDPNDNSPSISLPADNPYVTAVGGTALFVNNDGGSYGYEAGWEGPLEGSGGGGGVSVGYSIPSWQSGPGVSNQYSTGMRQVPDVSAAADPLTGYKIYDSTSGCSGTDCWTAVGGTSAAAPLWASLVVLANQQAKASGKKPMGFINPALYAMGSDQAKTSPFHDITLGGNLFYQATSGWDYSTGWGTPDAAVLVKALVDQAPGA
jgi:kumamolisin